MFVINICSTKNLDNSNLISACFTFRLRPKGCKFLKQETDSDGSTFWYDIGDSLAREKVGMYEYILAGITRITHSC
jgi:hypothetical protein